MKKVRIYTVAGLIITTFVVFAFQNCSKNQLTKVTPSEKSSSSTSPNSSSGASSGDDLTTSTSLPDLNNSDSSSASSFSVSNLTSETPYSETCDDFAKYPSFFSTKNDCLQDGRWHLIYQNAANGFPAKGSQDELLVHVQAAADFKVVLPPQSINSPNDNFNLNEECQAVHQGSKASVISGLKSIYCIGSNRFSGENETELSHGSARFGSDGSLACAEGRKNTASNNGCEIPKTLSYKWYAKY